MVKAALGSAVSWLAAGASGSGPEVESSGFRIASGP